MNDLGSMAVPVRAIYSRAVAIAIKVETSKAVNSLQEVGVAYISELRRQGFHFFTLCSSAQNGKDGFPLLGTPKNDYADAFRKR